MGVRNVDLMKYTGTGAALGTVGSPANSLEGLAGSADGGVYIVYPGATDHSIVKYDGAGTAVQTILVPNGTGSGQAYHILALGTDGAGNIYILDDQSGVLGGSNRVEKFAPTGSYLTQWGSTGLGNRLFYFSSSSGELAVAGDGAVYVGDSTNRIQKFTSDGSFVTSFGSAVSFGGQFTALSALTVDSAGHVYAGDSQLTDSMGSALQEFDSAGKYLGSSHSSMVGGILGVATYGDDLVYGYTGSSSRVYRFELTIPDASVSLSASTVRTGQPVTVSATASVPFGSVTTYAFDFGTGAPAASGPSSTATYRYGAPGSYQVTARVTSARGGIATVSKTITVLSSNPPVASVPGRIGSLGAALKFTFACQGAAGQTCHGQATATAIEKLSSNGNTITGVLTSKPRTGRYKAVVVAQGKLSAAASARSAASIRLNPTGQMLRNKFKNVPADVKVTATAAKKTTTIKTAQVTFGADPPKLNVASTPTTKRGKLTFNLRCQGLATQICKGAAQIATYAKLAADGNTIIGLSYGLAGNGKPVTLATAGYSVKAGNKLQMTIEINRTGKSLLTKFGRIPATLKLTPTYNGYTLTAIAEKIVFKR
jgi:hypothetical protein